MKLILSSCDFYNENSRKVILNNLPKPIDECKVLFIPNECATFTDIRSQKFFLQMESLGFERYKIFVFDYYRSDDFKGLDFDVIYMGQGNVFSTLSRIQYCEFNEEMARYIKSGVTYIGGGAGAYILLSDMSYLKRFTRYHNDLKELNGLGILDVNLILNYTEDKKQIYDELKNESSKPVFVLSDDDSIVLSIQDVN